MTQFKAGTLPLATHPIVSYDNSYPHRRETGWGSNSNYGYRRGVLSSVHTVLVLMWFTPCHQEFGERFTQQGCTDNSASLVTTVYCIMFSYHYRLAMIAQICPELATPESSFKLSEKPSRDRATMSSSKGTLHPANWEIVQDYNC